MGSELLEHSWTDAREGLQVRFGQECFQRWLADITVISSDAGHVRLGVANRFLQEWIETRYLDGIREVFNKNGRLTKAERYKDGVLQE